MKEMIEISKIFYNRTSLEYGLYKVIEFLGHRGKTNVPYYKCKFKNTGNEIEAPEKTIIENKVVDIEYKKKQTKKKQKEKKKEIKKNKYELKKCIKTDKEIILLSLDISSRSTGYAIFKENKLFKYGYIYQPREYNITKRLNNIKHEIIKLIKEFNINAICIEDIIYKSKVALSVLSKAQGIMLDYLYENNIDVGIVSPIEWKSKYNINRNSGFSKNKRYVSKMKTIKCVNKDFKLNLLNEFKEYPKDLKEPPAFDCADAIALGSIFLKNYIIKI